MESSASKPTVPQHPGRYQTIQVHLVGAHNVGLRALVHRICLQEYVEDVPYDPTGDDSGRKMVTAQQGPVLLNLDPIKSDGAYTLTLVKALAARSDALIYWEVSLDGGRELSSSIGAEFLITSAKTGAGCGDDDMAALIDRIYSNKARAEEERNARAANQAGNEMTRRVTKKSKVHLMISRVVERFKRLRDRQDPNQENSTSYTTLQAKLKPRHETQG
ncbi:hypothetical protein Neosp_011483 [[Neocosmospora] mangrovei]